jgi:hypothetical protein
MGFIVLEGRRTIIVLKDRANLKVSSLLCESSTDILSESKRAPLGVARSASSELKRSRMKVGHTIKLVTHKQAKIQAESR